MTLRRAWRYLLQRPATALPIVLTLALATGFTSAAAAVVYGVLLRPLPYAEAGRLVILDHAVPRAEIAEWRARLSSVEGTAGAASADHAVQGLRRARILRVAFVSTGFFETISPSVLAGRLPRPGEHTAIAISERVLRHDGTAPPAALGTRLTLVDKSFDVVGVVPADVALPEATTDLWLPAEAAEAVAMVREDDRRFGLLARLRGRATPAQAADEATRLRQALWTGDATERRALRVGAELVEARARGRSRTALVAFLVGGALMLLVASANVASLLLSRTIARERELAIALSLGATGRRVIMSLLWEALWLSAAGSALGLCLAVGAVATLQSLAPGAVPRLDNVRVDLSVIAFSSVVSVVVAGLCTIGPGWFALRRGVAPLVRSTAGPIRGSRRLQSALAGTQLALSIVLVVTGILLTRTIVNILDVPTGVRVDGVLTARLMLGERTLLSAGEGRAFSDRLLGEIERLPGVERAAFASSLPPATSVIQMGIRVVEGGRDETQMMALVAATTAWADAAGARVVDGRFLNPEDAHPESPGVVVSRSAARHLFGNRPAVGLSMPTPIPGSHGRKARVVGVVDDVRYLGLLASPGGAVYVPWEALPFGVVRLVVRMNGDPLNLVSPIRAIARRLDPSRPIEDVQPLRGVVAASASDHRIYAVVADSLGITSFAVALVGLLATLARMVTVRRHEFAVRIAVGATSARVAALVLRQAATVIAGGLVAGIPLACAAARGLSAYLYGVSATGLDTYAVVATISSAAGLTVCALPAWRALSLSPAELLRPEP
jgi:putative ABC transport system permease protein